MPNIYPVVLSGGSGTRLWPLSRTMYPKQFIDSLETPGQNLLGATLERVAGRDSFAAPTLICNNDHRFFVREQLARMAILPRAIILEPVGRNTAAAIAVAALHVLADDPDGVMLVMPSDHVIRDRSAFEAAVVAAADVAAGGRLVLFGIAPSEAHTGYGYIEQGAPLDGAAGVYGVATFAEKPDHATAERYVASGRHFWNSGIFVLHARTFVDELDRHAPEVLAAAGAALAAAAPDLEFLRLDRDAFERAPAISVDYAVMERTDRAAMLPIDLGWNDVGSWSSLWDVSSRDADGNHVEGDAILRGARDCYIRSEASLVAAIGVEGLVIVDTPDALLVADRSRTQEVGEIVAELKRSGRKEQEQHLRNFRPWGFFETLALGPRFQVKKLHVKPGGKLSLQMHHHRSEHWVVVQGTARVVVGDEERLVRENESIYIVATQWHRLENPGKVPLELIEVQIGSYLGEDDIIRSDDIYRRADTETR